MAGRAVRSAYQQQNSLVGLAIALRGASPADIATGMQVQRNVFGIQGNAITTSTTRRRSSRASGPRCRRPRRPPRPRGPRRRGRSRQVTELTRQVAADKAEAAAVARVKLVVYKAAEKEKNTEQAQYNSLLPSGTGSSRS